MCKEEGRFLSPDEIKTDPKTGQVTAYKDEDGNWQEIDEKEPQLVRKTFSNYVDFKALDEAQLREVITPSPVFKDAEGLIQHVLTTSLEDLQKEVDEGIKLENCPYIDQAEIMKIKYYLSQDALELLKEANLLLTQLHTIARELKLPFDDGKVLVEHVKRFGGRENAALSDAIIHPIYFPAEECVGTVKYGEYGQKLN